MPTAQDGKNSTFPSSQLNRDTVPGAIMKNWPTPRANDAEKRGDIANDVRNGLPAAVRHWPTPTKSDYKGCGPTIIRKDGKNRENDRLDYAVAGATKMYATPQARDYRTGQQSRWDDPNRSRNLNDQIGGQLNADWVEILMGFPIGWTDINCDEPQEWPGWPAPLTKNMWRTPDAWSGGRGTNTEDGYRKCVNTNVNSVKLNDQAKFEQSGQYDYEPPRVITGQKNRAKRLKCIGNAVSPEQIYPIFAAIAEIEKARD
jgi:DNA (cytosine-5)-methyltransferase 1